jgi:hypothetical protein
MVHQARRLAASRATRSVDELPSTEFDSLWAHEREFITYARTELGLSGALLLAGRETPSRSPASDALVKPANDIRREDVSSNVGQAGTK